MGGADGYAESRGDPGEGVVAAQLHERASVRRELALSATLMGDHEHRDPLDQGVGEVEYGRIWNQQGSLAGELRRRTPPTTAPEPYSLRRAPHLPGRHPTGGHTENAHLWVTTVRSAAARLAAAAAGEE